MGKLIELSFNAQSINVNANNDRTFKIDVEFNSDELASILENIDVSDIVRIIGVETLLHEITEDKCKKYFE